MQQIISVLKSSDHSYPENAIDKHRFYIDKKLWRWCVLIWLSLVLLLMLKGSTGICTVHSARNRNLPQIVTRLLSQVYSCLTSNITFEFIEVPVITSSVSPFQLYLSVYSICTHPRTHAHEYVHAHMCMCVHMCTHTHLFTLFWPVSPHKEVDPTRTRKSLHFAI